MAEGCAETKIAQDPGPRRTGRPRAARAAATALGLAAIGLWVAWWVASVRRDALVLGRLTWVLTLPFLAGDFTVNIDHTARVWAAGINPYRQRVDWICALCPYPPMIFRLFSWVSLVSTPSATRIWLAVMSGILVAGAIAAWRTRRALGLGEVPPAAIVAAVLYSTPAVLAMERGQCDPLAVAGLLAGAALLRWRGGWREVAAGGLLGLTAWVKYYPGLAVVGLLALRRWKAAAAFVAVAGLIGLADRDDVRRAIDNGRALANPGPSGVASCHPTKHSIPQHWSSLWVVRRLRPLRSVPGPVAAASLLLPAIAAVSLRVGRAADPGPLVLPYLLWLTAAATFAMPYSIDYNLVALPLAALAVWDRRDPAGVHVALGSLMLWWQPFALPVGGEPLFMIKLAALYAVGACLAARAREAGSGRLLPLCSHVPAR
jgi:hypothetical protein